jgi:hypothetical protein
MPLVELPPAWRTEYKLPARFVVPGATVGEVLRALVRSQTAIGALLFSDAGRLRRSVTLFVDDEDIRALDGEATPVTQNSAILVIVALAGG